MSPTLRYSPFAQKDLDSAVPRPGLKKAGPLSSLIDGTRHNTNTCELGGCAC